MSTFDDMLKKRMGALPPTPLSEQSPGDIRKAPEPPPAPDPRREESRRGGKANSSSQLSMSYIACPFCEKQIASDSAHCPECSLANPLGAGLQELKDQVANRNLIIAIKKMREMCSGLSLADAKYAIEKLIAHKGAFPQSIDELLVFTDRSRQPESTSITNLSPTTNAQPIPQNLETSSSSRIATRLAALENEIKREDSDKPKSGGISNNEALFWIMAGIGVFFGGGYGIVSRENMFVSMACGAVICVAIGYGMIIWGKFSDRYPMLSDFLAGLTVGVGRLFLASWCGFLVGGFAWYALSSFLSFGIAALGSVVAALWMFFGVLSGKFKD